MEQTLSELTSKYDASCQKQQELYQPQFEGVFAKLFELDSNLNPQNPCTSDRNKLQQALMLIGYNIEDAFSKAFIDYNMAFVEGKQLQVQGLICKDNPVRKALSKRGKEMKKQAQSDKWLYQPLINIYTPVELHQTAKDILAKAVNDGIGIFKNETNTPLSDEAFYDEILVTEAFDVRFSCVTYYNTLKAYSVIDDNNKELRDFIFKILKHLLKIIAENTTNIARIENRIVEVLKSLDELHTWGCIVQMLVLFGLLDILANSPIEQGDRGYNELVSLAEWLNLQALDKVMWFNIIPYSDEDKRQLEPLTNYLNSTYIGSEYQKEIKKSILYPTKPTTDRAANPHKLPKELDTTNFKKILNRAIQDELIEKTSTGYEWKKSFALFAYFVDMCNTKCLNIDKDNKEKRVVRPFADLFNIEISKVTNALNRITNQNKNQKPKNYLLVENLWLNLN